MHLPTRLCLTAALFVALTTASCTKGPGDDAVPAMPSAPTASPVTSSPSPWVVPKTLDIGVKIDQPGFNQLDTSAHEYAGFEKELADFLGERIGFEPDLEDAPSKDREKELAKGSVQLVIATYSITDWRLEQIDFVGPYLQTEQGLLVRAGYKQIKDRKDTAGKEICTVEGSTSKAGPNNPLDKDAIILDDAEDYNACVQRLRDGNVDAVWTDRAILFGFAEIYDDVRVVDKIVVGKKQMYGIGLAKHNPAMCRRLQGALREFMKEEWYSHFRQRFPRLVQADPKFDTTYKPAADDIDTYTQCTP
ncbi:transporter substrate-binding domain-containing protein [Streptomyces sp. NPDC050263]|uniref:transporter substrate-binding domain-containing protein n=1 Tax=Streptomyces sp. NPDC050263 TaxID=3155037 RepID=UPI003442EFE7